MVLFSKVNLYASFEMKNPAKLEGDVPEGSVDHIHGFYMASLMPQMS
jgi:hypothetical protein